MAQVINACYEIFHARKQIILLCGISGAGKSTFANKHFSPRSVLSADTLRGIISGDEGNQDASDIAFDVLYRLTAARLQFGQTVVIDNTNVCEVDRAAFAEIARKSAAPIMAVVINEKFQIAVERNIRRERAVPLDVIEIQYRNLLKSFGTFERENLDEVYILGPGEAETVCISERDAPGDLSVRQKPA